MFGDVQVVRERLCVTLQRRARLVKPFRRISNVLNERVVLSPRAVPFGLNVLQQFLLRVLKLAEFTFGCLLDLLQLSMKVGDLAADERCVLPRFLKNAGG